MMLDERKLQVLHAIIQSYIISAEPIGSRTISKKFDLGVSSATIRNEMSDLEELGYLVQPHTSAGRIPSDKAYRLYVNKLMTSLDIGSILSNDLKDKLTEGRREIDQLIQGAAKILASITNYTSLAIAPQIKRSSIKRIQLVPVDDSKILAVLVTDSGILKNAVFRTNDNISYDNLNVMTNFLNEKLKGLTIEDIGYDFQEGLIREMYELKYSISSIMPVILQSLEDTEDMGIYFDGVTNIFNFPEYNDISKAKQFLSFIEDKNSVMDMLINSEFSDVQVTIGSENIYEEIQDCSVITAVYSINGKTIGKIGVIGPTRMDYLRVITAVKSLSLDLNEIIKNYLSE
ncbi:heat-inducible transcription repressor HrcA [Gottschalkia purinilytica]|uniref:Heat-inducible transcription repressor HrcA n=1 Tax=Gottschalkia purinilytica TaxID=1503 RepID=A0A0L0WD56_GOTPU|nr:heat-inducible transcriptional repressor HrcA [Gottschalkia purinilytica]KNF09360.1 heat-inducible transcription repressor HrcA [Gottschalkia purinilytica]